MTGHVEMNHAILPLTFVTETRGDLLAKFIIDTAYTGLLTLPPHQIAALGLELTEDMEITLPMKAARRSTSIPASLCGMAKSGRFSFWNWTAVLCSARVCCAAVASTLISRRIARSRSRRSDF